jgi:uncharacterized delta-60 repeat protein
MKRSAIRRLTSCFEPLESRRMLSAGDLDPSFGVGGKFVSERVGFAVNQVALQRDGKIVAVGELNTNFAVARLNPNGTLDKSFGGGSGLVTTNFGSNHDVANAVAIQTNGKIVVAGAAVGRLHFFDMAIARYNVDGTLDKSFDDDGRQTITFTNFGGDEANALAIQPDGKILLAGHIVTDDFAVARLTSSGKLDRTFGGGLTNQRSGKITIDMGGDDLAHAIALGADGKIYVGGTGDENGFALARLTSDGRLDDSFSDGVSGGGKIHNLFNGRSAVINALSVEPGGSVLAAGTAGGDFAMARFKSNGRLDTSFGTGGLGHVRTDMGHPTDVARTIRSTNDGILVAGRSNGQFAIARYRNNGLLDGLFGANGKVITGFGADEAVLALQIGQDGRILAVGANERGEVDVARYIGPTPKVSVFTLKANASETQGNNTSLIVMRDQRLEFDTRVFLDLTGTATATTDYTGPSMLNPAAVRIMRALGQLGGTGAVASVDIKAGDTFAVVPIKPINDAAFEGSETLTARVLDNALYTVGDRPSQSIAIADNDVAQINFQREGAPGVANFVADAGAAFGDRGGRLKFGWNANNTANARARDAANSPNFLYDTFNHMQRNGANRKWEFAVPNGTYTIHLVMGDPTSTDGIYKVNVEKVLALSGRQTSQAHWIESTLAVEVTDGRLTISNAAGAANNKICYVEISNGAPKPLTPVGGLPRSDRRRLMPSELSSLLSTKEIDQLLALI